MDGTTTDGVPRLLLHIFSEPLIGPIFFEFIERHQARTEAERAA